MDIYVYLSTTEHVEYYENIATRVIIRDSRNIWNKYRGQQDWIIIPGSSLLQLDFQVLQECLEQEIDVLIWNKEYVGFNNNTIADIEIRDQRIPFLEDDIHRSIKFLTLHEAHCTI